MEASAAIWGVLYPLHGDDISSFIPVCKQPTSEMAVTQQGPEQAMLMRRVSG